MGIATAKDKSEVVYLTFDDDKPKDLPPNKAPITNFNKPRKVVKGIVGKAWLFDDNTPPFLLITRVLMMRFRRAHSLCGSRSLTKRASSTKKAVAPTDTL